MRGGVPGPSRIIKNGTGERDHVGVPGTNDSLCLVIVPDQPDRDDREAARLLYGAGERHLLKTARPGSDVQLTADVVVYSRGAA
jgi:hypothetical protein